MFIIKQINIDQLHNDSSHKREAIKNDFAVKFSNKSFGHAFLDYLGPTYYNSMPMDLKRNILLHAKKLILKQYYINVYFQN